MNSAEQQRCATDGGVGGGRLRHAVSIFNEPGSGGAPFIHKRPMVGCFICDN